MTPQEIFERIQDCTLFQDLPADTVRVIVSNFHPRVFKAGSLVMLEDQKGGTVGIIVAGTAKVSRSRPNGCTLLNIVGPGEMLGEINLLDGSGHSADIIALEELTLVWMERALLLEYAEANMRMYRNLAVLAVQRLRLASGRLEAIASLDVPGRVAFQLLGFSKTYGQKRGEAIYLPMILTQGDLAELIGATRTRVNQALAAMRRSNLLAIDADNRITILQPAELEKRYVIF